MNDAQRWREIAAKLYAKPKYFYSHGLGGNGRPHWRMFRVMQLFSPGSGEKGWWGTPPEGNAERVLACCFLAAMAATDGGNHRAEKK